MAGRNNGKIRQYRKPLNINLGIIIFSVIFIYIVICVFLYFTDKHIMGYEVKTGSLSVGNVYQGIALRQETIVMSTGFRIHKLLCEGRGKSRFRQAGVQH